MGVFQQPVRGRDRLMRKGIHTAEGAAFQPGDFIYPVSKRSEVWLWAINVWR